MIRLPKLGEAGNGGVYTGARTPITIVGVQRTPLMLADFTARDGSVWLSPGFFKAHRYVLTDGGKSALQTMV